MKKLALMALALFVVGVLLAPITAEIMSREILDGSSHELAAPFRADRFASA